MEIGHKIQIIQICAFLLLIFFKAKLHLNYFSKGLKHLHELSGMEKNLSLKKKEGI